VSELEIIAALERVGRLPLLPALLDKQYVF